MLSHTVPSEISVHGLGGCAPNAIVGCRPCLRDVRTHLSSGRSTKNLVERRRVLSSLCVVTLAYDVIIGLSDPLKLT